MMPTECTVCNKPLTHGLYNEDHSAFCTTVCATWFARAVVNTMFIPGDDWRRIENWLSQFTMVIKKREKVKTSSRHPLDRAKLSEEVK